MPTVLKSLSKSSVFKMLSVHMKAQNENSNSSDSKSVLEKLRLRDGLVRKIGLNFNLKLRSSITRAQSSIISNKACDYLASKFSVSSFINGIFH